MLLCALLSAHLSLHPLQLGAVSCEWDETGSVLSASAYAACLILCSGYVLAAMQQMGSVERHTGALRALGGCGIAVGGAESTCMQAK